MENLKLAEAINTEYDGYEALPKALELEDLPDYIVLDYETSIKNVGELAVGDMKASPFHPDNKIVLAGRTNNYITVETWVPTFKVMSHTFSDVELLVGQNIKFDLLYMLKVSTDVRDFHKAKLWDTMIVEYLITGMRSKYASLDKLSEKYGGTLKDNRIKDYWDRGVDTEDISDRELRDYLEQDVLNTEIVFKAQWKKVIALGMMPLVEAQMRALKATIIMEHNGMHFDIDLAYKKAAEIHKKLIACSDSIISEMEKSGIDNPNPASNDHISLLLFGGKQKVVCDVPILGPDGFQLRYKTGKKKGELKYKLGSKEVTIDGMFHVDYGVPIKKKGFYKVDDEQIKLLTDTFPYINATEILSSILEYRTLSKDLNTYFIGFAKHYWPHDKKIHGSISHCGTATGRLSSQKPNLQNLTSKD
jgi:DNA polymerase I-like protein with 3'-5' exonuclease and polymerase domains